MMLRVLSPPAQEPLVLSDVKTYLRVDSMDEDSMITTLITVAREYCEAFQNRAFITQTLEYVLDQFPRHKGEPFLWEDAFLFGYGSQYRDPDQKPSDIIKLPHPPLQSVTSITYTDSTGTTTTIDPTTYIVDSVSEPARIIPATNQQWPVVQLQPINGVSVTYIAGYGDPTTVPASVKQAMMMLIAHWYENREAIGQVGGEIAFAVRALLSTERVINT